MQGDESKKNRMWPWMKSALSSYLLETAQGGYFLSDIVRDLDLMNLSEEKQRVVCLRVTKSGWECVYSKAGEETGERLSARSGVRSTQGKLWTDFNSLQWFATMSNQTAAEKTQASIFGYVTASKHRFPTKYTRAVSVIELLGPKF